MRISSTDYRSSSPAREGGPVCRANSAIIFNSPRLAVRGAKLCQELESEKGIFIESNHLVDLSRKTLDNSPLVAPEELKDVDLLFIGLELSRELPSEWDRWLLDWTRHRGQRGGLLMLLGEQEVDPDLYLWDFFNHIARDAGLRYWCEWVDSDLIRWL